MSKHLNEIQSTYFRPKSLIAEVNQFKDSDWFLGFFCSNPIESTWETKNEVNKNLFQGDSKNTFM